MRFRGFSLLIAVLLPNLGQAQLGFTLKQGQHRVQFPIEVVNNLVILPVVLNGQLPLKFILDTGVRTTILTEKAFSDILNLTYSRHYLVAGPGGEKIVEAYVTNNVTLDMPGIHGEGHAMLVLEQDYLELRNYLGTDVQGILGYELFSRFIVEIDYDDRRLTITLPEYYKVKRKYQVLPIEIQDTKPYIHTPIKMLDGTIIIAKLLVDSGGSHSLILDPASDSRITIPEKHINSLIGRGLGGTITGKIARIKSIDLGNYHIENVIVNFPDPNSYIDTLKASDIFRNGSMGGELLQRFTTVYDFPAEKIYIKKNSFFGQKFAFNLSGLTLRAKGARLRRYEISNVREGSNAYQAGIQKGDELLTVNGLPAADLDLNSITAFFNLRPGKRVRLELMRNGQTLVKKFLLESQI